MIKTLAESLAFKTHMPQFLALANQLAYVTQRRRINHAQLLTEKKLNERSRNSFNIIL